MINNLIKSTMEKWSATENIFYNDTKYPDFELSRFEIREFQKKFLFRSGTR